MYNLSSSNKPLVERLIITIQSLACDNNSSKIPKIVFLGRKAAGKTTLINAVFGYRVKSEDTTYWNTFRSPDGNYVEIFDYIGFQDASLGGNQNNHFDILEQGIRLKQPDIFCLIIKAKEVNAAIKEDINCMEHVVDFSRAIYNVRTPVIIIVSQCDELDPPYIKTFEDRISYPQEWEEKLENINKAVELVYEQTKYRTKLYLSIIDIIPVASYTRMHYKNGTADTSFQWNIR